LLWAHGVYYSFLLFLLPLVRTRRRRRREGTFQSCVKP
jgi:hypothetical protein